MATVIESLNNALKIALEKDQRVLILGEDILDPYGGAFKVTRGLSSSFPDQVLATPVSEAGIVGIATGMALRGFRPIVEIMFGDFVTLAADQLINHATKFRYMYNNQVRVPIVIRTPMGGRRGYGPTHSQTMEKFFMGVPNLYIFAPNIFIDPGELLLNSIFSVDDPVLFVENKIQYTQYLENEQDLQDFTITQIDHHPTNTNETKPNFASPTQLSMRDSPPPKVTVAAYGYMADLCRHAALRLAYEDEIFIDIILFSQILPLNISSIQKSLQTTRRLLVVEEGTQTSGWGAEVITSCLEQYTSLHLQAMRVASPDNPIPASSNLEQALLPGIEDIISAVKKMV
jgi:pyruvate/2-oxoglutarate/acetoin dehydrogenase E1 component